MGITEAEFWRMTPLSFGRMREGYQRRNRQSGVYFREMYALLCNINRKENASPIAGTDILALPGDQPLPEVKHHRKRVSVARMSKLYNRFNGTVGEATSEKTPFSPDRLQKIYERFNPKPATA